MHILRTAYIAVGSLLVIEAVCQFVFANSRFFTTKRLRELLSESKRAEYLRAMSIPIALYGLLLLARSAFSIMAWLRAETLYLIGLCAVLIWAMIVNKIYLGSFFLRKPKKN